jgi:cytoskeletal protein CcmA (bactofilin family)
MPPLLSLFLKKEPHLLAQIYDVSAIIEIFRKAFRKGMFLIPEQVSVQGTIESPLPGRVDGNVRGDVNTTGMLIIGKTGNIRGNIHATDLIAYGRVFGDIFVSNKAVISNKAYIKGDITALILEVEEEAIIEGAIRKNVPDPETIIPHDPESEADNAAAAEDEEEKNTTWF